MRSATSLANDRVLDACSTPESSGGTLHNLRNEYNSEIAVYLAAALLRILSIFFCRKGAVVAIFVSLVA